MANQKGCFGYTRDLSGLYDAIVSLSKEYLLKYEKRDSKVIEYRTPNEINQLIDFTLPEEGISDEEIIEQCKSVLEYSVHTAHPYCFNQLWIGVDQMGLLGQLLTTTTHTLMYTFEMAPVFTIMESRILQELRSIIGWADGDGIFAPGGSIANLYGLLCARYHKFPESKKHGIKDLPQLVFFASEEGHYSNLKAAIIMGIGTDGVISVKCDKNKMDPVDLDKKIKESKEKGYVPFAVVATSGTTVTGAFDPLEPIADVCRKHDLWLHIDAAYGGSCLITEKHKHLMSGCERADSVTWDMHKCLLVPQQCSAILIKHKDILTESNGTTASYLFQKDKYYDTTYDTGDKSLQCGRVNDVFKFWLMWKAKGKSGFATQMENSFKLTKYLTQKIKERNNFELIWEPEFINVCFYYTPASLQGIDDPQERLQKLNKVAPKIKAKLVEAGSLMVGYQPLKTYPNFFRMVVIAPHCNESDMDHLLDEIERFGKDL